MRRKGTSNKKGERGQALIELALVLLLLSMIVFGITEFGRYFFYRNTFNNAARAGVRQAVVTPGLSASSTACPGGAGSITAYVCNLLVGSVSLADRNLSTVTVIIYQGTTATLRTGAIVNGDRVQVQVSYRANASPSGFTILTGSIIPFFSGSRPIVGDASMRYEL